MNWRAGERRIQRNTLEEKHDEIQRLNTANFEWQFSKCREATWDNTLAISRGQEREEEKKKRKERGVGKAKERSEERWQQHALSPFLFFPSSFPYSLLFLDLPFLSLCRRDRKGKERESGEREERKRERKGKEREFIAVIFPCSPFLLFIFPSLLSFFLSSLSLASLTRQAWCHMSFFKHSEAVSQKW